jgi:hypothetical protein
VRGKGAFDLFERHVADYRAGAAIPSIACSPGPIRSPRTRAPPTAVQRAVPDIG